MAIKVEFTKEPIDRPFSKTKSVFKVQYIHAYKFSQLPPEYLLNGWRCWMSDDKSQLTIISPDHETDVIKLSGRIAPNTMPRLQQEIIRCGDHLSEVKKQQKKEKEKLSPTPTPETFTIKY